MSVPSNALVLSAFLASIAMGSALGQQPDSRELPSRDLEPGQAEQAELTSTKAADVNSDAMNHHAMSAQSFANQAATIGKAEIELGQLALKNSGNSNVKQFAQRMVTDHTAANGKLKEVAAQDKLALPKDLDAEHKAVEEKLSSLKGEAFDTAYVNEMAKGHDKAVALFESVAQSTSMPAELKEFAASTLPTLKEHQRMAHKLHPAP